MQKRRRKICEEQTGLPTYFYMPLLQKGTVCKTTPEVHRLHHDDALGIGEKTLLRQTKLGRAILVSSQKAKNSTS